MTAELSAPRDSIVRRLFALSMNRCAFPSCSTPIIRLDQKHNTVLAEICHIHAQNPKGPRYKPDQTSEERHAFENLVLMCSVHHKIIDAPENLSEYTAERLLAIKAEHQRRATESETTLPQLTRAQMNELRAASSYAAGYITHMDFRQAVFKAGGEGGRFGAGGGGGVITIVGTTQVPPEANLDLDGQFPGGGGGALNFVGRSATSNDLVNGLQISSIFTADSFRLDSNGTFHVLGGGWTWVSLKCIPSPVSIHLVCVIELGSILENTLIRFEIGVIDPKGRKVSTDAFDVAVDIGNGLIARRIAVRRLSFDVIEAGVWTFRVLSGGMSLASYDIEIRAE